MRVWVTRNAIESQPEEASAWILHNLKLGKDVIITAPSIWFRTVPRQ